MNDYQQQQTWLRIGGGDGSMSYYQLRELYYFAIFGKPPKYNPCGDRKYSHGECRRREYEHARFNMICAPIPAEEQVRLVKDFYSSGKYGSDLAKIGKQDIANAEAAAEERKTFDLNFEAALRGEKLSPDNEDSYGYWLGFDGGRPRHPQHYRRFLQALTTYNNPEQLTLEEAA